MVKPPAGFRFVASLPDIMPKVFGHYFSSSANAYDLWISAVRHQPANPDAMQLTKP
jgi:hypothetical protein